MNTQVKDKPKTEDVAKPAESKGEVAAPRAPTPVEVLRAQMEKQKPEFDLVLPPGVTVDRFVRTIMTAVQADPDLLDADRKSLLQAAMQAAQDGLLPDKREGAFVIYNTKVKDDNGKDAWIKMVQWMPMIRGIIKKAREGGEIATLSARVVYEHDEFEYILGDAERIEHKPTMQSRGKLIACYAIAKMKNGEVEREVMTLEDVNAVRSASRSKTGPWSGPFEGEMWRKSVIRRLLKRLPMTPILEQIINRDESHYEFKDQRGINWQARPAIDAPPAPTRADFRKPQDGPDRAGAEDIGEDDTSHARVNEPAGGKDAEPSQEAETDQKPPRFTLDPATNDIIDGQTGEVVPENFVRRFVDGSFAVLSSYLSPAKDDAGAAVAGEEPDGMVEPSFIERSIAHLQTLKTVTAVTRWYDDTFLEDANARDHVTKDDIAKVNAAKNQRLGEITAKTAK